MSTSTAYVVLARSSHGSAPTLDRANGRHYITYAEASRALRAVPDTIRACYEIHPVRVSFLDEAVVDCADLEEANGLAV